MKLREPDRLVWSEADGNRNKNSYVRMEIYMFDSMISVFRDSVVVAFLFASLGIVVNIFHPESIDFFAKEQYEILVPCPEPGGEVNSVKANDPILLKSDSFVVDARSSEEYRNWHFGPAVNIPYDYLEPTPAATVQQLAKGIAKSGAKRVLVYGDGDQPDTGEQLGKEISGNGIKNVFFICGGAPLLKARPSNRSEE